MISESFTCRVRQSTYELEAELLLLLLFLLEQKGDGS